MHLLLDQHEVIGWDMDGTLVGPNAPNAEFFRDYIIQNPHKRHHIITFRNRSWASQAWSELRRLGLDSARLIRSVENCPEILHDCYDIRKNKGSFAHIYRDHMGLTVEAFNQNADAYVHWKGERCQQIGCTVMIDDVPPNVLPGCLKHGIEFLDAHAPIIPMAVA